MKCTVLFGSPRKQGNTAFLTECFLDECRSLGMETQLISLYETHIEPCLGCMACQDRLDGLGCVQKDDLESVFQSMAACDLLVLATPIYAWYCTAPMKALMDRAIYAGNKKYGKQPGPAMLAETKVVSIATCGYPVDKGTDLWEAGVKRWCRHGKMKYLGQLCQRDLGSSVSFADPEKEESARLFARRIYHTIITEDV